MRDSDHQRPSRLAIVFVAVGLTLAAIGIAYIIYADPGRERDLPPLPPDPPIQELNALYRVLSITFVLFLAFLVGSYAMVRLRRRMFPSDAEARGESQYVDAWSNYRLSDDQIDVAMQRFGEQYPADAEPGDEPPDEDDAEPRTEEPPPRP